MPIVFENVEYLYPTERGEVRALHNINLTIEDGEFVSIIGHTGSGKSTLVEHMNSLRRPSSGRVLVDGYDTSAKRKTRNKARALVGFVTQNPEKQLFAASVADDIAFGPRNLGYTPAKVDESVRAAMETMGLDFDAIADVSPFDLSGGQQRRVAIAGILAMHPKILILDEPIAGLDPCGRKELANLIKSIHVAGTTVITVTHSMADAAQYSTRVIVMNQGEVFMDGKPREVFSHASELRKIGLGIPRATAVANDLAKRGFTFDVLPLCKDELAQAIVAQMGTAKLAADVQAACTLDFISDKAGE